MSNRLFTMIKSLGIATFVIIGILIVAGYILLGEGNEQSIQDRYPLESVAKDGKQESYVYRVAKQNSSSGCKGIGG